VKTECRDGFWSDTERFEGRVYCLYLDVLGLVTTAIGNLCDDPHVAMAMPFLADGKPATPAAIAAEHAAVKACFCGVRGAERKPTATDPGITCAWRGTQKTCLAHQGWKAAMKITKLRLNDDGVKGIVLAKLDANDADLARRYPAFELWPWQAQLATHSMSWACGTGFGAKFPRLRAALFADDFRKASTECHINETGNPGVAPRNVRNVELYLAAVGEQLDPSPFDVSTTAGVQATLARLGFDPGPADGKDGPHTREALKAFQRAHNLHDDGIVGPHTRLELVTALRTAA
jgi:hypothetical protein